MMMLLDRSATKKSALFVTFIHTMYVYAIIRNKKSAYDNVEKYVPTSLQKTLFYFLTFVVRKDWPANKKVNLNEESFYSNRWCEKREKISLFLCKKSERNVIRVNISFFSQDQIRSCWDLKIWDLNCPSEGIGVSFVRFVSLLRVFYVCESECSCTSMYVSCARFVLDFAAPALYINVVGWRSKVGMDGWIDAYTVYVL